MLIENACELVGLCEEKTDVRCGWMLSITEKKEHRTGLIIINTSNPVRHPSRFESRVYLSDTISNYGAATNVETHRCNCSMKFEYGSSV